MVRNQVAIGLVVLGIVLAVAEMNLSRVAMALYPATTAAPVRAARGPDDVPLLWREIRANERTTDIAPSIRICGAALERGLGKSALVVRLCSAMPRSPERRYAFGFDDFIVRASLPGGATLAYDLLTVGQGGGTRATEGPLPENNVPITSVRVDEATDLVFVLDREFPVGALSIEVSGRFDGNDVHDTISATFGENGAGAEMARVGSAPDWARASY